MATETLRERLGLGDEEINRLAGEGMPTDDPLRTIGWLVEKGKLIPPRIVPAKFLAEFFGCVPLTISNWQSQGMPSLDDGMFDLDECCRWRLAHIRKSPAADQLAAAKASKAQLDLAERLGEVAPVEPLLRRMSRRINEAKAILNQLPDAIAAAATEAGVPRDIVGLLHQRAADVLDRTLRSIADLGKSPDRDEEEGVLPEG